MSRITFFLLLCFLNAKDGWSRTLTGEPPLQHLTVDDGLPSNTIYDIYKDSKGFLWFCTDKGVARYNGLKFETFTTSNGLPDNEIFFAKEDYFGRIWLATFNGALCYFKSGTFHTAENTKALKVPFKTSFIKNIIVERDSSVTISYYDQKIIVNVVKDSCHVLDIRHLFESMNWRRTRDRLDMTILCAFKEKNNQYALVCQGRKIVHVNDSARFLYCTTHKDSVIGSVFFDRISYFFGIHGIYEGRQLRQIKTFNAVADGYSVLHRILSFNGYFYRCTDNGLFINPAEQVVLTGEHRLLRGIKVSGMATDSVKSIWISTLNDGVYAMPIDFNEYNRVDSISSEKVLYAATVRNTVFFGTVKDDLFVIANKSTTRIFSYSEMAGKPPRYNYQPSFLIDGAFSFYNFYRDDYLFVDNLFSSSRKTLRYQNPTMSTGVKYVFSIGSQVYLQARRNLAVIDYKKLRPNDFVAPYYSNFIASDSLNSDRIFCVAQDNDSSIWYSTVNDMHRVVGYKSVIQSQFKALSLKKFIFFHNQVVGYTHDNRLLICANYKSRKLIVDTMAPDNCIWESFFVIDSSHLLVSTNNLYRLMTFAKGNYHNVSVSIVEDEYVPRKVDAICSDSTYIYFFQGKAVTLIRKDKLLLIPRPPKLIFTTVKTANHIFSICDGGSLALSYKDSRNISIGFLAISYVGKNLTFQYAIDREGASNWNAIQGEQINLANSKYGTYTIRVRARSLAGEWSEPISYAVKIKRPYWATWWFISCITLLGGAVVVYFIRRRINVIVKAKAKENENKVRYLKSEYKALNALMNPHFIFNTLNNVQGLFNRDDKRAANEYLRIFADLVRQNMHNVSMEMISLEKEIELVRNYLLLEKLRFKDNLHYEVTIDEKVDASEIMVPPLLIQPLVENSIKHGILPLESSSGIVKVDISERNSILYIRVADNGIGFNSKEHKKDSAHISFGLDNIRRRIEQLSAILEKDLTFEMKEEQVDGQRWTVAIIAIPV